jgi:hypothetical protein
MTLKNGQTDHTTKAAGSAWVPCAPSAQRDFRVGRTVGSQPEASPTHISAPKSDRAIYNRLKNTRLWAAEQRTW